MSFVSGDAAEARVRQLNLSLDIAETSESRVPSIAEEAAHSGCLHDAQQTPLCSEDRTASPSPGKVTPPPGQAATEALSEAES